MKREYSGNEIAIVGIGCRFPRSEDWQAFWHNLLAGRDLVSRFTREELLASGVPAAQIDAPAYVPVKALLEHADSFDAEAFGYSPREAARMDPQLRVLHEVAVSALADAGIHAGAATLECGVFVGSTFNVARMEQFAGAGADILQLFDAGNYNDPAAFAAQLAYRFKLIGPAANVQTACSTSLAAVHLACRALLAGECQLAMAGGVCITDPQAGGYSYQPGMILSEDGVCRPFCAEANGTVNGNGAALVVLKLLDQALADGDPIHAIVVESAMNNDGDRKVSFEAPSVAGQAEAIGQVYQASGIPFGSLGMIEAHGTATSLGDPIEIQALARVAEQLLAPEEHAGFRCAVGSVKSNMGHLDTAAGVAGLIKAALSVRFGRIPPSLHHVRPNPHLRLEQTPFFVPQTACAWPSTQPLRRAGVSSFGIGGTNVHVLVEAPPASEHAHSGSADEGCALQVIPLAARSFEALDRLVQAHARNLRLADVTAAGFGGLAQQLRHAPAAGGCRSAFVCASPQQWAEQLAQWSLLSRARDVEDGQVWVFGGQGTQVAGMGLALAAAFPRFGRLYSGLLERAAGLLGEDPSQLQARVRGMQPLSALHVQPVLYCVQAALGTWLLETGITPRAVCGYSLGEFAAAAVAGVFTIEAGLALVVERARLMAQSPPGALFAVSAPQALPALPQRTWCISELSPRTWALATAQEAVPALEEWLQTHRLAHKRIPAELAFHTPLVDAAAEAFGERFAALHGQFPQLQAPALPLISTATGLPTTAHSLSDAAYWVAQMRQPLRWPEAAARIGADHPSACIVQIGPGTELLQHLRKWLALPATRLLPTLGSDANTEVAGALSAIARSWEQGQPVQWPGDADDAASPISARLHLPGPAFRRRRFAQQGMTATAQIAQLPMGQHFYGLQWRRYAPTTTPLGAEAGTTWVLCRQAGALEQALSTAVQQAGGNVRVIVCADRESAIAADREALAAWLRELGFDVAPPAAIVMTGLLDALAPDTARLWSFWLPIALARLSGAPLRLLCAASGLSLAAGQGELAPDKSQLMGPLLLIPQEFPAIATAAVDLHAATPAEAVQALAPWLAAHWSGAACCAWRDGQWWRREVSARLQDTPTTRTLPNIGRSSWALITGANGGMGRAIAEHLARVYHCNLILLVREPVPARAHWHAEIAAGGRHADLLRWAMELTQHAARVELLHADLGSAVALEAAFAPVFALAAQGDGLDVVFHAAGRGEGALMQLRDDALSLQTLAPKVEGTRFLCENRGRMGDPAILLFSSLGNLLPHEKAGQVAYVSANACLEAHAERVRAQGGRAVAIGWDDWAEAGMALRSAHALDTAVQQRRRPQDGDWSWRRSLDAGTDWWLDEHRLDDATAVLPAMGALALVQQALAAHDPGQHWSLCDVAIEQPLVVHDGVACDAVIRLDEDRTQFVLYTGTGDFDLSAWTRHVSGRLQRADLAQPLALAADAVDAAQAEIVFQCEPGQAASPQGALIFGPRWRNIERVERVDAATYVNHLALPGDHAADLDGGGLHVALLDTATLIGSPRQQGQWAPLSISRFTQHAPMSARAYSRVQVREAGASRVLDVRIHAPDGTVQVVIEGLLLVDGTAALQRQEALPLHTVLRLAEPGAGTLAFAGRREPRRAPGADEVEIRVHVVGLNFKDVLIALGVLPPPPDPAMTFGQEAAGVVVRVGTQVRGFRPGDRVMCAGHSCLADHVLVSQSSVAPIPSVLGFHLAAGLPVAFTTAWLALRHAAQLQPGEHILIHAAAGGVGLAAVQIALHLGAKVWATAGSDFKRQLLLDMGVQGVGPSRDSGFAAQFRAQLGERPFDVILNALAGELTTASVALLAPQGRFLELGLRDILEDAPLALGIFAEGGSYHAVQAGAGHPRYAQAWREVVELFEREVLVPLPTRRFSAAQIGDAFQYMAQARHVGKLVIDMPATAESSGFLAKLRRDGLSTDEGVQVAMSMAAIAAGTAQAYVAVSKLPIGQVLENQASTQQMLLGNLSAPTAETAAATSLRDCDAAQLLAAMQQMLAQFLGVAEVDPDAAFFSLGATSLDLIQFARLLTQRMEREVSVATLFSTPSLRQLAAELAAPASLATSVDASADRVQDRRRSALARRRLHDETAAATDVDNA
ncbi:MAG: type I polyketide synthase [Xanthomonas sp.]